MQAYDLAGVCGIEHIALTEELLGADLVEDGAAVDLGGDAERTCAPGSSP